MFARVHQVRSYGSVMWASASEKSISMDFATMDSFKLLSEYFSGANGNGSYVQCIYSCFI